MDPVGADRAGERFLVDAAGLVDPDIGRSVQLTRVGLERMAAAGLDEDGDGGGQALSAEHLPGPTVVVGV